MNKIDNKILEGSKMLKENFVLNNGVQIPKIGFGTWQISNEDAVGAVEVALKAGYIHIDSASGYGNEEGVGQAVRASGIPREELFITTKVPAEIKTYEEAVANIEFSLAKLDLGYIDLLLIHAPQPWDKPWQSGHRYYEENVAVWKALEEFYKAGKVKSIGISNFFVADMENMLANCEIKPMVNQISYHIGNTQKDAVAFCRKHDILVQGYSPIATGRLLDNEEVGKMADKLGVSIAQLCIKYVLQKDILPLPKSNNAERIVDNTKLDFVISDEDMAYLDTL